MDPGFYSMYKQLRTGEGGSDRTWTAMDKDRFFVSKELYSALHGCNSKITPCSELFRLLGKWDYDCSK